MVGRRSCPAMPKRVTIIASSPSILASIAGELSGAPGWNSIRASDSGWRIGVAIMSPRWAIMASTAGENSVGKVSGARPAPPKNRSISDSMKPPSTTHSALASARIAGPPIDVIVIGSHALRPSPRSAR